MTQKKKHNIIILDDHLIVIEGIKRLLKSYPEYDVVKEVTSIDELYASLGEVIDILFLDINVKGVNSIKQIPHIKAIKPDLKILIFSSYDSPSVVKKAFEQPIHGYLLKDTDEAELIEALETVIAGKIYVGKHIPTSQSFIIDPDSTFEFDDSFLKLDKLTKREKEVTDLMVKGLNSQLIAEQLFISSHTVKVHRKNIFKKLEIHSVAELINLIYSK